MTESGWIVCLSPDLASTAEYNSQTSNMQKKYANGTRTHITAHERTRISDPFQISLCPHRYYKHIGDTQYIFLHNPRIPASSFSENTCPSLQKTATTCTKISKPQERQYITNRQPGRFLENILFTTPTGLSVTIPAEGHPAPPRSRDMSHVRVPDQLVPVPIPAYNWSVACPLAQVLHLLTQLHDPLVQHQRCPSCVFKDFAILPVLSFRSAEAAAYSPVAAAPMRSAKVVFPGSVMLCHSCTSLQLAFSLPPVPPVQSRFGFQPLRQNTRRSPVAVPRDNARPVRVQLPDFFAYNISCLYIYLPALIPLPDSDRYDISTENA